MSGPYNPLTRQQFVDRYISILMSMTVDTDEKRAAATEVLNYKKQRGISWDALGITPAHQTMITTLLVDQQPQAPKLSNKVRAISARLKPAEPEPVKLSTNDSIRLARDQEVARLLGLGKTTTEIYQLTDVPRRTVDRIRDKFIT